MICVEQARIASLKTVEERREAIAVLSPEHQRRVKIYLEMVWRQKGLASKGKRK